MPADRAPRPPRLLVLVGVPGAGKSTYARRIHARRPRLRIVSPDDIREALHPGYAAGEVDVRDINDRHIFRAAYAEVDAALEAGEDVLFDATSLTAARRHPLLLRARRHGARAIAHYFPVTVAEAIRRNAGRHRRVPPGAIARMAQSLQPPTVGEGFARVVTHL